MHPPLVIPRDDRNNYCVCSVLQAVFARYGMAVSQDEVSANLTRLSDGHDVNDDKIKSYLESKGFHYSLYWHNTTPFNEPDWLLRDIAKNDGFIGLEKHVYRVLSFSHPILEVDDPKDGSKKEFDFYDLLYHMEKEEGCFGLIKKLK